jgi:phosphate transport system permease protein
VADAAALGGKLPEIDRTRRSSRKIGERAAEFLIRGSGWLAIVILGAIALFLAISSWRAIVEVGLWNMITGVFWYPTSKNAQFGFLPAEVGSLWVTLVGMSLCVPFGVASAVYLSEFAGSRTKEIAKSIIEFMAGIPSVVLGLIGLALFVPAVKEMFDLDTGLTAFTAGLMVGIMATPTIVSISEDALHAVPRELRWGSAALGNTAWQTTYKVVVPAAGSGIFAACMLGMGRAIGETMVVLMLAGNAGIIPATAFESARTLPGTIANELGEVVQGGLHYSALFAMGLVLFAATFLVNLAADAVLDRQRKRWRR